MGKKVELVGRIFGSWYVRALAVGEERRSWVCVCTCGSEAVVSTSHLTGGNSTQCRTCSVSTHGASRKGANQRTYFVWRGMRNRCMSPSNKAFDRYGARGITVCKRWLDSFEAFIEDMGPKPKGRSLDRIDNNGPYCKENCRWATSSEQSENTSRTIWITFNGERRTMTGWSQYLQVPRSSLNSRVRKYGAYAALDFYLRR
jgi:hypothetical protein